MSIALQGSLWRPGLPPGIYEHRPEVARRPLVRLDVAALIGLAERGPVNTAVVIDDLRHFEAVFGAARAGLNLPLAVRLFFANGGRRCIVVRCVDYANVRTTRLRLPGLLAARAGSRRQVRFAARNPGSWGNRLEVRCQLLQRPLALGLASDGTLIFPPDRPEPGATLRLLGHSAHPGLPPRSLLCRVVLDPQRRPQLEPAPGTAFMHAALLAGAVELSLRLEIYLDGRLVESWDDAALHRDHPRFLPRLLGRRAACEALLPPAIASDPEGPTSAVDRRWGERGEPWGSDYLRPSALLADSWLIPTAALLAAPNGLLLAASDMPASRLGRDAGASTERRHFFEPISMNAAEAASDADTRFAAFAYCPGALDALEQWDNLSPLEPVALVAMPDLLHPAPPQPVLTAAPLPDELCFSAACQRQPATLTCPALDYPLLGFDAADLLEKQRRLVADCEARATRIALLDLPPGLQPGAAVRWRHALASDRAALYTPWLQVDADGNPATVPPSGAMAGVIAQVENDTGVWAAPANRPLQGVFARAEEESLNDPGFLFEQRIDEIRATERGLLPLAARSTATTAEWTHLPVRRLIDWLKAQLAVDLAWAVFEPNDALLWSAMAGTARRRLLTLFNAGALAGRGVDDSFFVRCDASTHSQSDLDAGRAILHVGVAPAVPAEFIVFQLVRGGPDAARIEVL